MTKGQQLDLVAKFKNLQNEAAVLLVLGGQEDNRRKKDDTFHCVLALISTFYTLFVRSIIVIVQDKLPLNHIAYDTSSEWYKASVPKELQGERFDVHTGAQARKLPRGKFSRLSNGSAMMQELMATLVPLFNENVPRIFSAVKAFHYQYDSKSPLKYKTKERYLKENSALNFDEAMYQRYVGSFIPLVEPLKRNRPPRQIDEFNETYDYTTERDICEDPQTAADCRCPSLETFVESFKSSPDASESLFIVGFYEDDEVVYVTAKHAAENGNYRNIFICSSTAVSNSQLEGYPNVFMLNIKDFLWVVTEIYFHTQTDSPARRLYELLLKVRIYEQIHGPLDLLKELAENKGLITSSPPPALLTEESKSNSHSTSSLVSRPEITKLSSSKVVPEIISPAAVPQQQPNFRERLRRRLFNRKQVVPSSVAEQTLGDLEPMSIPTITDIPETYGPSWIGPAGVATKINEKFIEFDPNVDIDRVANEAVDNLLEISNIIQTLNVTDKAQGEEIYDKCLDILTTIGIAHDSIQDPAKQQSIIRTAHEFIRMYLAMLKEYTKMKRVNPKITLPPDAPTGFEADARSFILQFRANYDQSVSQILTKLRQEMAKRIENTLKEFMANQSAEQKPYFLLEPIDTVYRQAKHLKTNLSYRAREDVETIQKRIAYLGARMAVKVAETFVKKGRRPQPQSLENAQLWNKLDTLRSKGFRSKEVFTQEEAFLRAIPVVLLSVDFTRLLELYMVVSNAYQPGEEVINTEIINKAFGFLRQYVKLLSKGGNLRPLQDEIDTYIAISLKDSEFERERRSVKRKVTQRAQAYWAHETLAKFLQYNSRPHFKHYIIRLAKLITIANIAPDETVREDALGKFKELYTILSNNSVPSLEVTDPIDAFIIQQDKQYPELLEYFNEYIQNKIFQRTVIQNTNVPTDLLGKFKELHPNTPFDPKQFNEYISRNDDVIQNTFNENSWHEALEASAKLRTEGPKLRLVERRHLLNPATNVQQLPPAEPHEPGTGTPWWKIWNSTPAEPAPEIIASDAFPLPQRLMDRPTLKESHQLKQLLEPPEVQPGPVKPWWKKF